MKRLVMTLVCLAAPAWSEVTANTNAIPRTTPIWKVCIMPADASLTRIGMKGGESLAKESEDWAEKLDSTVKHAVTEAGASVIDQFSADQRNAEDARQAVVSLKRKYENISLQLRKKPGAVKNGRYTLGDEVALVPCASQADVLAFVNGQGVASTGGRKTYDVLVGGAPNLLVARAHYHLWVSLVDARSGQLIAFVHEVSTDGKSETDPEGTMVKILATELRRVRVGWVRPPLPPK